MPAQPATLHPGVPDDLPVSRRASPAICAACLRQHVRLASTVRAARRQALVDRFAYEDPVTRLYVEQLFDHLTLGAKVFEGSDPQVHLPPPTPRAWTAEELDTTARTVVRTAFGL